MPKSGILLKLYMVVVVVFLLLPIGIIIPMSFSQSPFLRFPPVDWGPLWYRTYFQDRQWIDATLLSFRVALASASIATALGTLAAIALERTGQKLRAATLAFLSSPIVMPHIFIALGVFLIALHFDLMDSELLLVGAHATMAIPFVVLMVGAVVRQLDISLERAARILGAGPVRAFWFVTLPTLVPSMVAAYVVAFFLSFDELIVALFTMSGKETLPMRIWANLRLDISPVIAAVASLLIIVTAVCMILAEIMRRRSVAALGNEAS